MAAAPRRRHRASELDEYQRSMQEFREMLERAGHKAVHSLKHPKFIENDSDSPRRPRR